jgi:hypothetical protein
MARRSLFKPDEEHPAGEVQSEPTVPSPEPKKKRAGLMHVGGYYPPDDSLMIEFSKLGIDLRTSKQDMLREAIEDFVAKHKALKAFR